VRSAWCTRLTRALHAVCEAVRCVFEGLGKTRLLVTSCFSSKAVFPWSNVLGMIEQEGP